LFASIFDYGIAQANLAVMTEGKLPVGPYGDWLWKDVISWLIFPFFFSMSW